jgi:hypothetical protein
MTPSACARGPTKLGAYAAKERRRAAEYGKRSEEHDRADER